MKLLAQSGSKTLQIRSGEDGRAFHLERIMLIKHQIILFQMRFQMSFPDNRVLNGNSQPKILKSVKVLTTANWIFVN